MTETTLQPGATETEPEPATEPPPPHEPAKPNALLEAIVACFESLRDFYPPAAHVEPDGGVSIGDFASIMPLTNGSYVVCTTTSGSEENDPWCEYDPDPNELMAARTAVLAFVSDKIDQALDRLVTSRLSLGEHAFYELTTAQPVPFREEEPHGAQTKGTIETEEEGEQEAISAGGAHEGDIGMEEERGR